MSNLNGPGRETPDTHKEDGSDFFFITGRGRSGTGLLKSMLNNHPGICVVPEGLFVLNLYPKYRNRRWTQRNLEAFYRDLWLESRMNNWWDLDKKVLRNELAGINPDDTFSNVCRTVYRTQATSSGKDPDNLVLIGDKNPTHTLFLSRLQSIFPESLFLHIVRDFRDNILSFQNVSFDHNAVPALAERWRAYNENFKHFRRRHPERTLCIRFETLLTSPEQTLRMTCKFLRVSFTKDMMRFHEATEDLKKWQKNLGNPLNPQKAYRWKQQMKPEDQNAAEFICGGLGRSFGYHSGNQPPPINPLFYVFWMLGYAANVLEVLIFVLPVHVRSWILTKYRQIMEHE